MSETPKSLADIARCAYHEKMAITASYRTDDVWEHVAQAVAAHVRAETIEECAKLFDSIDFIWAKSAGYRIRALNKEAQNTDPLIKCPQCGCETTILREGYCEECRRENQSTLDLHNAGFDRWYRLSPKERDDEILRALNKWAAQ